MLLTLKNIGKVSDASIELNGITVIAGENNTGKSTVGKMLFCLFNSFYDIDKQIRIERESLIRRVIDSAYVNLTGGFLYIDSYSISDNIVEHYKNYINNIDLLKLDISNFYLSEDKNFASSLNDDLLTSTSKKIIDFLDVSDEEIKTIILKKRFNSEFNMQISHINNPAEISQVTLKIRDNMIDIAISQNDSIAIKNNINIYTELVYIDDPFVLDDLKYEPIYFGMINDNHRSNLKSKLSNRKLNTTIKGAIEEIVTNKKIDKIFNKLSTVCDGELIETDNTNIAYKSKGFKEALDISNISMGLKTFIIIKTLLTNGILVENGTLVLDEPEIHLHPQWQLLFAEIIVLIQKEFGMHILLNTHSPYFLNAIEVYAAKYEIADRCKYYLAENQDDKSIIKDVSDNIDSIYAKLARPLQDLENEANFYD